MRVRPEAFHEGFEREVLVLPVFSRVRHPAGGQNDILGEHFPILDC